jgi:hypothetical protein
MLDTFIKERRRVHPNPEALQLISCAVNPEFIKSVDRVEMEESNVKLVILG